MARVDEKGRELRVALAYLLNRPVTITEIQRAVGATRNTFARRLQKDDFPNAEECRLIAKRFELNPLTLLVKFRLISLEQIEDFIHASQPVGAAAMVVTRPARTLESITDPIKDEIIAEPLPVRGLRYGVRDDFPGLH